MLGLKTQVAGLIHQSRDAHRRILNDLLQPLLIAP
jgi:hypothetical protein